MKRQCEGIGPLDAKIMLIGEALGADERIAEEAFRAGKTTRREGPFCGWSGKFLRDMCERADIGWDTIRVDNVIQYQPERNDFSVFYKDKSRREPGPELLAWWTDLRKRILEVRPNVIVTAGDEPLYALTGNKSSTTWRGSVVPFSCEDFHCWIVPIVHPSYSRRCYNFTSTKDKNMRQPWFHITVYDLQKAKRISENGWHPEERIEKTWPSYYEVMEYLEELDAKPSDTMITIDVETLRRKHIKCLGLTHDRHYAMCIPFVSSNSGRPYFSLMQEAEIWRVLDKVLTTHRVNGQTIAFDLAMLWRDVKMDITESLWIDTAILHALLYPELKHDLGFLASIYTDMPYFKHLGRTQDAKANIGQIFEYNCFDVQSTHEIAEKLRTEAQTTPMWEYYLEKRRPLAKWAIRQHRHGICLDVTRQQSIIEELYYEEIKPLHDLLSECLEQVNYPMAPMTKTKIEKLRALGLNFDEKKPELNVNSPQQVKALLTNLGYHAPNTSDETLSELAENSEVAKVISELRSNYSLLTSLGRPPDEDGRFRTAMQLHVTETTRLSSTKSHYGGGSNLQNITKRAKKLFIGSLEEED